MNFDESATCKHFVPTPQPPLDADPCRADLADAEAERNLR